MSPERDGAKASVMLLRTNKKNLRKLLLYQNILNGNFVGHETGRQKEMMFFK